MLLGQELCKCSVCVEVLCHVYITVVHAYIATNHVYIATGHVYISTMLLPYKYITAVYHYLACKLIKQIYQTKSGVNTFIDSKGSCVARE